MFTAIIVAAGGLAAADALGLMSLADIFVPTTFFWATLVGGCLVGAGMAIGGYCPGTSAAAFASGRLDAFVFMVGMVLGTGAFAGAFDLIKPFYLAAPGPDGQTLQDLFAVSSWIVIAVLAIVAILGFVLGSRLERSAGGPLSAETVDADAERLDHSGTGVGVPHIEPGKQESDAILSDR